MSDREGPGDDDVGLPKATVAKLIQGKPFFPLCPITSPSGRQSPYTGRLISADEIEMLPPDMTMAKDVKDYIVECCVGQSHPPSALGMADKGEWIKLISTQSNAVCEASTKKTISPEHVLEALKVGDRPHSVSSLRHRIATVKKQRAHKQQLGFENMVEEVAASETEFKQVQKARQRAGPDTKGMTPEELAELQERLFANSQARFAAGQGQ